MLNWDRARSQPDDGRRRDDIGGTSEGSSRQTNAGQEQEQKDETAREPASSWALSAAVAAAQTGSEMRQRLDQANDQLGHSLHQLYVSASTMANEVPPAYHNIPGIVPYYHGRNPGPPPSYDDVVNPHAAPPTYQSLFGQMREARKSSRGLFDLLRRLTFILISTIGCTILLAFMILIPFTMIIVGAIYIDDCRIEHIPTYLLLGGLIWATKNIFHCYRQCRSAASLARSRRHPSYLELDQTGLDPNQISTTAASGQPNHPAASDLEAARTPVEPVITNSAASKSFYCELVLNFSLLGWFIAGCVIVFRNNQPDFQNPSSPKYCNRTVYMYTFWIIVVAILLFSLLVGCFCCLMVSSVMAGRQEGLHVTDATTSGSSAAHSGRRQATLGAQLA